MLNNLFLKKFYIITIVFCLFACMSSFAKQNPFNVEVDEPTATPKTNKSEGIIIFQNPYEAFNPINPVPAGVNKEEYDSVNNYNISLKNLEKRIQYFSPRYKNIKQSALSSYWMAYYVRGGNDDLVFDSKKYTSEILDLSNEYKNMYKKYESERNLLDKNDPNYEVNYNKLTAQISTYEIMYKTVKTTYDTANKSINATKTAISLGSAMYNIGNVDDNTQVSFARGAVTKSLSSAIMTYLQLRTYVSILEKQTNLYYDMYKLNLTNFDLGLSTALDVTSSLNSYDDAKNTLNSTKTTMKNVKEQIAINLGYKLEDLDKLNFEEPEIDFEYITSINLAEDKKQACTSNASYKNIKLSDKDKKLPQSTGEEIMNKRMQYVSDKISAELENLFNEILSKSVSYESSLYLEQIYNINESANLRKLNNNLVSKIEYDGLEVKNLANKLNILMAKYDLINATNDYYYGVMGHIEIS